MKALLAALGCLGLVGCAARQPMAFRFVGGKSSVLVPPGVRADATLAKGKLSAGRGKCRIPAPFVRIRREDLESAKPDTLVSWADSLSKAGCLSEGQAQGLVERAIDSVPLEVDRRWQILTARGDLRCPSSIKIVSPVDPEALKATRIEEVAEGKSPGSLQVTLADFNAATGIQTAWYDLLRREDGDGCRIAFRGAEVSVAGKVVATLEDRFGFTDSARWFQLFMMTKSSVNDFDHVILAGATREEFVATARKFRQNAADVLALGGSTVVALPPLTGVNAFVRVKANGKWLDVESHGSVRQALRLATGSGEVPSGLRVAKLSRGKLYPVIGLGAGDVLLFLPLEGGEEISWGGGK